MNAVVDVGNTFIKVGLFDNDTLVLKRIVKTGSEAGDFIDQHKPRHIIVSSVSIKDEEILKNLNSADYNVLIFDTHTPIPVKNEYQSPHTLGRDRIAGAVGANFIYPDQNCLILDSGTCIKFDFITSDGSYLGGSISPGINMKFKALSTFTSRLPLIEPEGDAELIGRSTYQSIMSGVLNGTLAEVQGTIDAYSKNFQELKIIICGGDSKFFESRIKGTIFVIPELVLIGLNRILQHNVSV